MDLRETSLGFHRAWHVAVGARHGLLLALRDAPLAPGVLAGELGLAPEPVALWCRGAWALGLLERNARGRFRLRAEHASTLGEPASPEYLGHHFEYLAQKSLRFGELDALLRGKPTRAPAPETYALATRYDHLAFFEIYLPRIPTLRAALARGIDVLDFGAGEGGWTREAMRRFPASRYVASDLDTRALRGLRGARVLSARKIPPARADLVYLGEVLAAARKPDEVLGAAYRALRPGGRLVALEGLLPPEGRAPRGWGERLVLAMGLDFSLDGSRYLGKEEALDLVRGAGFERPGARDLGGSLFAIAARKPQA
jgi:SAM-dependent methyltransferase